MSHHDGVGDLGQRENEQERSQDQVFCGCSEDQDLGPNQPLLVPQFLPLSFPFPPTLDQPCIHMDSGKRLKRVPELPRDTCGRG